MNWWHCASVYMPAIKYALVALLVAQLAGDVQSHTTQIKEFVHMVESVKAVGISLLMKVWRGMWSFFLAAGRRAVSFPLITQT